MATVQAANLAVRFLLEIVALGVLGYWGFHAWAGQVNRVLFGVGAPVLLALAWALLASPQAPVQLSGPMKVGIQMALLGIPVLALLSLSRPVLAAVFGSAVVVNAVLLAWWRQ